MRMSLHHRNQKIAYLDWFLISSFFTRRIFDCKSLLGSLYSSLIQEIIWSIEFRITYRIRRLYLSLLADSAISIYSGQNAPRFPVDMHPYEITGSKSVVTIKRLASWCYNPRYPVSKMVGPIVWYPIDLEVVHTPSGFHDHLIILPSFHSGNPGDLWKREQDVSAVGRLPRIITLMLWASLDMLECWVSLHC